MSSTHGSMMDIYQLFMKDTRMCIDVAWKLNLGEPSHCENASTSTSWSQEGLIPPAVDTLVRYANQEEGGCPRIFAEVG